jgi:MFS family permease
MNSEKLMLYSSVFALQGLCNAVIPVLPELVGNGVENSAVASNLLYSGYFLGAFLSLFPFGLLADRFGNLKVAGLGILLTALSGLSIFISDSLWVLVASRFVEGLGCGAFFPAAFSMLAEWKDSQKNLGEFNSLLNAGLAAGVFSAGVLAEFGVKTAIGIFTILAGFSSVLFLLKIGRSPEKTPNRKEKQKKFQGTFFLSELGTQLEKARETFFKNQFLKIWGTSVLLYGATGLITASYPEYSSGFLTKPELGLAISASYLAAMLGSLAAGKTDLEYKYIIRTGITFVILGVLFSVKFPVIAFSLIGAGGGIALVGLVTAVSRISSNGITMGLFNTGIYAGLGIVPVFGSLFLGRLGYEEVFLGSALALFVILFLKPE